MKRELLASVAILLPTAALAQPACNALYPSSLPCQSRAVNLQQTDELYGTQATGPLRPNQTVNVLVSQVLGALTAAQVDTALTYTPVATITLSGAVAGAGAGSGAVISTALTSVFSGGSGIEKITVNSGGQVTSGGTLVASDISAALGYPAVDTIVFSGGDIVGSGSGSATVISASLVSVTAGGTATKVVVNSKGLVTSESTISAADLPLQNGAMMYPLGDNSGTVSNGLYTILGAFPWSSGNVTGLYAAISGASGSMKDTLYVAVSGGASLVPVSGCSGLSVSSGSALGSSGNPAACTATPVIRGGQIFVSVTSVSSSGATDAWVEPVFTRTGG